MTFLSVRTGLSRVSAEYRRAFSFVPIMAGRFGIAPPGSKRASLAYRNLRRSGTRWLVDHEAVGSRRNFRRVIHHAVDGDG
jgi:hypothetical protein